MTTTPTTIPFEKFPRWLMYYVVGAMVFFPVGAGLLFTLLFDGFGNLVQLEDTVLFLCVGGAVFWGWVLNIPFYLGILFIPKIQKLSPEQHAVGLDRYVLFGLLLPVVIAYGFWQYWDFLMSDLLWHLVVPVIGVTFLFVLPLVRELFRLKVEYPLPETGSEEHVQ